MKLTGAERAWYWVFMISFMIAGLSFGVWFAVMLYRGHV